MKVWRIRLKGTNLFYQPVKGRWNGEKSNLSPAGKIYVARKPTLKDLCSQVSISNALFEKYNLPAKECKYNVGQKYYSGKVEWEIVQYDCVEECTL